MAAKRVQEGRALRAQVQGRASTADSDDDDAAVDGTENVTNAYALAMLLANAQFTYLQVRYLKLLNELTLIVPLLYRLLYLLNLRQTHIPLSQK